MFTPGEVYAAAVVWIAGAVAVLLLTAWAWAGGVMFVVGLGLLWRAETGRQDARHAEFLQLMEDHDASDERPAGGQLRDSDE
jgi:hypothetical protein